MQAHQSQLDDEIRNLRRRNAELEEELQGLGGEAERRRIEALQAEVDRVKEESDSLRHQLSASQADAADASRLAEELQGAQGGENDAVVASEKALVELRKEMRLAAERAAGELEAGMEAKRAEVKKMQERAEMAEADGSEMRALVEELTHAGQVSSPRSVIPRLTSSLTGYHFAVRDEAIRFRGPGPESRRSEPRARGKAAEGQGRERQDSFPSSAFSSRNGSGDR